MTIRRRYHIDGIVQGVGFRPFVYNLARELDLTGWVKNTTDGVFIEAEGDAPALDDFFLRLELDAPRMAQVVGCSSEDIPTAGEPGFRIVPSDGGESVGTLVPVDAAVCADCLREIRDPDDRRYRYPFTNCTNCGPRWTIIARLPYDRPHTSMAPFEMCPACRAEYEDPDDRRFHAQPNACPVCGPLLSLAGAEVDPGADPLREAARLLGLGRIVAIKGLGGFHLAVRADDAAAVERLRRRKTREAKPLAVMVPTLEVAGRLGTPDIREKELLASPQAPIVLLKARPDAPEAGIVAAGHRRVGVMLPYTPLHHLLFDELGEHGVDVLVMTSGNLTDEPICIETEEAEDRLGHVADALMTHDRDILRRADDSVVQVLDDRLHVFRRGRGFAPVPILVGGDGPPVLAVGPELKNTVCLLKADRAFVSPHIGDLDSLPAYAFFQSTIATLKDILKCEPEIVAYDMHPGYRSTRWAKARAGRRVAVQHHHAHLASVLAEHRRSEPAIGLIMDGTGYGTDGTIWGGEILFGNAHGFNRLGHFSPVPLPGGDAAIRAPWRAALSYLREAFGDDIPDLPVFRGHPVDTVLTMLEKDLNCPRTSSCGRLFDAVAAICGPWAEARYEAQAAIELMALATPEAVRDAKPYDWEIDADFRIPTAPLIRQVVADVRGESPAGLISARFHRSLIDLLGRAAERAARETGCRDVVLAGGVFQNELLISGLDRALATSGFDVLRPIQLPPNDGAVAVGQAVIARTLPSAD